MTTPMCGVGDCASPARWERVSQADADLHPYLCGEHWKMLHQHNWIAASAYRPLSAAQELAVIMDSAMETASPPSEGRQQSSP
jgi:hypothetical protein